MLLKQLLKLAIALNWPFWDGAITAFHLQNAQSWAYGISIWIMRIEHSTLVMIARGVTAHKIFPRAHETSNDALKAEGRTQKASLRSRNCYTQWHRLIVVSWIEPRCRFFDPTSVWRDIAANRNWHFQFICYFSTNCEDTIVPIVSFDPASNSTSIRCLTLLWAVVCTTRFTKWRSHHGQKMDPPYRNYR